MIIYQFLIFGLAIVCSVLYTFGGKRNATSLKNITLSVFVIYSLGWIVFMIFLWFNHINFPLNLEAMELTMVQHLQRVMEGKPIYVNPSSDFVPLAYTPLYYYFSAPFAWLFGVNLFTMRLVAVLGMIGAEIALFLAIKRQTNSNWWAIIAVGFFAAAYRVMDTYLDNAHSDSWLLFMVLLGCFLIELNRSRAINVLGILFLVISFWFKQHGAIFAIGGVLYLVWRDGIKNSWLYWILAVLLGPGLYAVMPADVFGPQFHYYTFTVPSHWGELNFSAIKRYFSFIIKNYIFLAGVGGLASFYSVINKMKNVSIWYFMLPFAMLSGVLGALDPGSNNNVFVMMGVWFIITGVLGFHTFVEQYALTKKWAFHLVGIGASFALLYYIPASVMVSPSAPEAYDNLISYLNSLEGPVYAPWLGQLQSGYSFSPSAHWVPMEDLIRGPGVDIFNHPNIRTLLEPVIYPKGNAYILMNYPLEDDSLLTFLLANYRLEKDLGERFAPLSTLPKRFNLEYPRYLYKIQK